MAYEFHEDEAYLFQKVAENFGYIYNKNISLPNVASKWTLHIRRMMDTAFTLPSVRKFVTGIIRSMKNGVLPPIAHDGGELQQLGYQTLEKYGINPRSARVKYGKYVRKGGAFQNTDKKIRCRQYCAEEQEFLFVRLAERIEDFMKPKQKSNLYKELSIEMSGLGYSRTHKSIQKWIEAITEGKWPAVVKKSELAWARQTLNVAFNLEDNHQDSTDYEKKEDGQMKDDCEFQNDSIVDTKDQMELAKDEAVLRQSENELGNYQEVPIVYDSFGCINVQMEAADKPKVFQNAVVALVNDEGTAKEVGNLTEVRVGTKATIKTLTSQEVQTVEEAEADESSFNDAGSQIHVSTKVFDGENFIPIYVETEFPESYAHKFSKAPDGEEPATKDAQTQVCFIRGISEGESGYSTFFRLTMEVCDGVDDTLTHVKTEIPESPSQYNQVENINAVTTNTVTSIPVLKECLDTSYEDFQRELEKLHVFLNSVSGEPVKEVISCRPYHYEDEKQLSLAEQEKQRILNRLQQKLDEYNAAVGRKSQYEMDMENKKELRYELMNKIALENFTIRHCVEDIQGINSFLDSEPWTDFFNRK